MLKTRCLGIGLLGVAFMACAATVQAADLDKYLPNDTQGISTLNVRQILDSGLVKKYGTDKLKEALRGSSDLQKQLDDLGLDPFKDISSITLAGMGGPDPDKGLIIIHGKFDQAKIEAKIEELTKNLGDAVKITKSGTHKIYETMMPDQKQPLFASVADAGTIIAAGNKKLISEALDKVSGKKESTVKKELQDLIKKTDAKQSLWVAGLMSKELLNSPLASDEKLKDVLQKVESLWGGITIADDIKVDFSLGTKDDDAAKEIADLIEKGVGEGKNLLGLLGGNKKELAPISELLDSVKISSKGKGIGLKGGISKQILDKTLNKDS